MELVQEAEARFFQWDWNVSQSSACSIQSMQNICLSVGDPLWSSSLDFFWERGIFLQSGGYMIECTRTWMNWENVANPVLVKIKLQPSFQTKSLFWSFYFDLVCLLDRICFFKICYYSATPPATATVFTIALTGWHSQPGIKYICQLTIGSSMWDSHITSLTFTQVLLA